MQNGIHSNQLIDLFAEEGILLTEADCSHIIALAEMAYAKEVNPSLSFNDYLKSIAKGGVQLDESLIDDFLEDAERMNTLITILNSENDIDIAA